jgi:hypothetical protein
LGPGPDSWPRRFVNDLWRRQQLLEELSLNRRLRLVIENLREKAANAAA